ncbi:MAG: FAD-binding oxidoreductase, partial [Cyanobacteria bacterium RM1_2_2]|nr:FAD-binding oxidoreductase [Cyanobacteria bacterium RM1_2_2]
MRYDGYYILSDLLETPNLAQRSKDYLYYLVRRYVYRARKPRNPANTSASAAGCSSRNGGQVSTSIKPSFTALSGRHNEQTALGIRREGLQALDYIEDLIRAENIDCDWARVGRYHAAHNPRQYEALADFHKNQPKGLEVPMEMVPRAEQHREIPTDRYYGGAIYPRHAKLHPGKYHLGLLRMARGAGVQVVDHCPATAIQRDGQRFRVKTP